MRVGKRSRLCFVVFLIALCFIMLFGVLMQSENWFGDVNAASTSDLKSKTVLFDGDSIAKGSHAYSAEVNPKSSYADYIEITYGIKKTNLAYGGARLYWPKASDNCTDGTNNCHIIPNHLTSTVKNNTYDYIVLEGGINDLHTNYYNGDHESYAAALRNYFNTITTNPKWAYSKIGFVIVPRPDYSRKTHYRPAEEKAFWKTIQNICDEYSIEYINFFKQDSDDGYIVPSGFNWNFMNIAVSSADSVGSFDGLHPSKGAHEMLGEYIAKWMINLPNYKYKVSFDNNGSSLSGVANQSVVHGKRAVTPTYSIDTNQHFSHWSKTKNGVAYNFNSAVNDDLTLYAVWNVNVKFDGRGGKISGETSKTVSIVGSSKVSNPGNPVRDGYNFTYWSESNNCESTFDFNTAISRDKTLYACWSKIPTRTYSLSFDLGKSGDEVLAQECITTGTSCTVTIPNTMPSYPGYYFLGYADTPGADTIKYQLGNIITLSADKTVYAVWADGSVVQQDYSAEYIVGSGNDMTIRINYPLAYFVKLMIDGNEVDNVGNDKYKLESGSTIITIYSSYLDVLELGDHVLQVAYDNGTTKEVGFKIKNSGVDNNEVLPAPSTSSEAPNAGNNTKQNEENVSIVLINALPVVIILVGGLYMKNNKRAHRIFE